MMYQMKARKARTEGLKQAKSKALATSYGDSSIARYTLAISAGKGNGVQDLLLLSKERELILKKIYPFHLRHSYRKLKYRGVEFSVE
jgi:hypothetical protein